MYTFVFVFFCWKLILQVLKVTRSNRVYCYRVALPVNEHLSRVNERVT